MIESRFWKEDLLKLAKKLQPIKKPRRWSERRQVNFEKEIIISFFKIRKLFETKTVSSKSKTYKAEIFQYPNNSIKVTNLNYWNIFELYDLDREIKVKKSITFICNQLIHGGATFAYRNNDRNWGGVYTCSDFERDKYIYRIPIDEFINILNLVGNDYPTKKTYIYSEIDDDYKIETD